MNSKTFRTPSGLPRVCINCGTRATANEVREQFPDAIVPEDDRRRAEVVITGDTPPYLREEIEAIAYEGREEAAGGAGQLPLSQFERSRLDFTRTNVFHARACKALADRYGVQDWVAHYDSTLTVDEHDEVFRTAAASTSATSLRDFPAERHTPFQRTGVSG